MRKTLLAIALFASTSLLASNTPKESIEGLKKLADKVEKNHKSYTDEDWAKIILEYENLEREFKEKEYSKEELKEFGRQKGRIKGYMAHKTLKKWGEEVENFATELEGGIEGFFEAMESTTEKKNKQD